MPPVTMPPPNPTNDRTRKKAGIPIAKPIPKQIDCRFVSPAMNFCLISDKSLGMGTYCAKLSPPFCTSLSLQSQ